MSEVKRDPHNLLAWDPSCPLAWTGLSIISGHAPGDNRKARPSVPPARVGQAFRDPIKTLYLTLNRSRTRLDGTWASDLWKCPLKFFVAAPKKCVLPFVGKTTERHACLGSKPGLTSPRHADSTPQSEMDGAWSAVGKGTPMSSAPTAVTRHNGHPGAAEREPTTTNCR